MRVCPGAQVSILDHPAFGSSEAPVKQLTLKKSLCNQSTKSVISASGIITMFHHHVPKLLVWMLNPTNREKPCACITPVSPTQPHPTGSDVLSFTRLERVASPYSFQHLSLFVMRLITLRTSHPSHALLPASGLPFKPLKTNRAPRAAPSPAVVVAHHRLPSSSP